MIIFSELLIEESALSKFENKFIEATYDTKAVPTFLQ